MLRDLVVADVLARSEDLGARAELRAFDSLADKSAIVEHRVENRDLGRTGDRERDRVRAVVLLWRGFRVSSSVDGFKAETRGP